MIPILITLLVGEHVALPVAQARVAVVLEACEAAAPGDALMVALCAWNAYRESRMDPAVVGDCQVRVEDAARNHPLAMPDGQTRPDRAGRETGAARPASRPTGTTCRALGAFQLHAAVVSHFGAACGRDRRDVRASACMFVRSVHSRGADLVTALASHMSGVDGGTLVTRRKARARVAWARRNAR